MGGRSIEYSDILSVADGNYCRSEDLNRFIDQSLNPVHERNQYLFELYIRLHSLVVYFGYAAGSSLNLCSAFHRQASDAEKVSAAIGCYAFLVSCEELRRSLPKYLKHLSILGVPNLSGSELTVDLFKVRNQLLHPHYRKLLLTGKRSRISSNGQIDIRMSSTQAAMKGETLTLDPFIDVEAYRNILSLLAKYLDDEFKRLGFHSKDSDR